MKTVKLMLVGGHAVYEEAITPAAAIARREAVWAVVSAIWTTDSFSRSVTPIIFGSSKVRADSVIGLDIVDKQH